VKLAADKRSQAVARAQELGLLGVSSLRVAATCRYLGGAGKRR